MNLLHCCMYVNTQGIIQDQIKFTVIIVREVTWCEKHPVGLLCL